MDDKFETINIFPATPSSLIWVVKLSLLKHWHFKLLVSHVTTTKIHFGALEFKTHSMQFSILLLKILYGRIVLIGRYII